MVKADLTRDYYGDLEIQPNADLSEIKKQFKKLALTYHPDRNPGREGEVIAKFQKIQSAHEVLSDPQERAKYDAGRVKSNGYKTSYTGSSGVRGNPWSNVSAQYPPPPKHPTARANRAPPPSAGAARYKNFETPKTSASQSAHEGAEARKKTYEAWESMRGQDQKTQTQTGTGSGRSSKSSQPPRDYAPKDYTSQGRDESNSNSYGPPPKGRPGYEEYRPSYSPTEGPHRRAQSTGASNRKGFMPNTPGGDEPAAPKGAYFTQRNKPQQAPEPPPRAPPPASMNNVQPDPLRQFREKADRSFEPRLSTPYATHGGEKFNPFEHANLNRSRSTRDASDRGNIPRAGSDSNLATPHRARSFADRSSKPSKASYTEDVDTSDSDYGPEIPSKSWNRSRAFAKGKTPPKGSSGNGQPVPKGTTGPENKRKPSVISQFQTWYRENPGAEPPLTGFPSDGPPSGSGQANPQTNGDPTMYGPPRTSLFSAEESSPFSYSVKLPTVSEEPLSKDNYFGRENYPSRFASVEFYNRWPYLFPKPNSKSAGAPPSGVAADCLNAFEAGQRSLIDHLVNKRRANNSNTNHYDYSNRTAALQNSNKSQKTASGSNGNLSGNWSNYRESAEMRSPSKERRPFIPLHPPLVDDFERASPHPAHRDHIKTSANDEYYPFRFSFKVDDDTFATSKARSNRFTSNSAENINTKFTPEEWEGKFEAGSDYFRPEQKAANVPLRGRAQSGSRSRGRSPIKVRPVDPRLVQTHPEQETPIESPGGTKFTPEEWAQSFKPQTFMPPPASTKPTIPPRTTGRKARVPNIRPTMGTAAVVDDGETSDEKPLFDGRKPVPTPTSPSPDVMDVDTPPATTKLPTPNKTLKVNTEPLKRPAAPSQSPSEASLKVNFEDLKIQDLISSLDLPKPPPPPKLPEVSTPEYTRPPRAAYETYLLDFKSYMCDWDLFNSRIMLHLVARKNQNDGLGARRWEDERALEVYRRGLKEDGVVLGHLVAAEEGHQVALKDYAILREAMHEKIERERPRKKVY